MHTWADNFGRWHAQVDVREQARAAIKTECVSRGAGEDWPCEVELVDFESGIAVYRES